ncbi:MAG: hypothetical protein ABSC48_19070 [Terracidiphilus sp.]|jgi:uncharacterized protein HemY
MTLHPGDRCLTLVYLGADAMQSGNFGAAEQMFRMAEKQTASMSPGPALDFSLLVRCHMSLLRHRLGKTEEGKKLQDSAMTLLDENSSRMEAVAFQSFMAKVLMQLHEYRRAIPFCARRRAKIRRQQQGGWRSLLSVMERWVSKTTLQWQPELP